MSALKISKDDVVKVYQQLSKYEVGHIDLSKMGDWMKGQNSSFSGKTISDNFQVLHKVARNCNEGQFIDFVLAGELPPTKLTEKEMEAIKGGATPWVGYAIGYGLIILADMIAKR